MKSLKAVCEKGFGIIAKWSFNKPWLALLLVCGVSLPIFLQLPHLTMDTTNESFFRDDDEVLIQYNEFREQFGKDEFVVLAIESEQIFSFPFLKNLQQIHTELQSKVPYVEEITSLINVRETRGEDYTLSVNDFIEKLPETPTELESLKERARKNELYRNFVLSKDQKMTTIIIEPFACNPDLDRQLQEGSTCEPMNNKQNRSMMAAVEDIVTRYQSEDLIISISGMPAVIDFLNVSLMKDMATIIPVIFIMVMLILAIIFKRVTAVVYPLLIFFLSLLSTIGLMALLGIPMTNITTIVPSFILVVSVSDAVHILALFYPAYQRTKNCEQAIIEAMEHSGLAILMTTLTTAGGFLSFSVAKLAPIADLGLVAPLGIFLALFYTVLLLPALLALFPVRLKPVQIVARRKEYLDDIFKRIAVFSCQYRWTVICTFFFLFVIALLGVTQLRFSHNALKWFSGDASIRQNTELIDRVMGGTLSMDVVIDTGKPDGLYDPDFIRSLEEAALKYRGYLNDDLFVGKIISLVTVLKETNRALHGNQEDQYKLPDNRELIAQELFLFQLSGNDDLESLTDPQFSKTRLTMHIPYRDSSKTKKLVTYLENDLEERFPEAQISVTGVIAIFVEILNNVMETMARSYGFALLLISFCMVIMLGRVGMGLLSMVPNLFPIIMIMGLMGWFAIPLDFGTILVGSIAMGIVVDDTIHFLHNFSRYYDLSGVPQRATEKTLQTAGRALFATSIVLTAGYLCDLLSVLMINRYVGFLIAATVFIALITDFFLVPAILSLVYGERKQQSSRTLEVAV